MHSMANQVKTCCRMQCVAVPQRLGFLLLGQFDFHLILTSGGVTC